MTVTGVEFDKATARAGSDASLARRNRATVALIGLKEAGEDSAFAITAVALSISECASQWLTSRVEGQPFSVACYPSRTCVGVEMQEGHWYPSTLRDAETQDMLRKLQMLGQNGRVTGDALVANSQWNAAMLEWAIMYRKPNLLKAYSLGPTQMWLAQTPMSVAFVQENKARHPSTDDGLWPAGGNVTTFPQTWEAIFELYTARTVADVAKHLSYLRGGTLPGSRPYDEALALQYLRSRQTGSTPGIAENYYNSFFKGNLVWAYNRWNEINSGAVTLSSVT